MVTIPGSPYLHMFTFQKSLGTRLCISYTCTLRSLIPRLPQNANMCSLGTRLLYHPTHIKMFLSRSSLTVGLRLSLRSSVTRRSSNCWSRNCLSACSRNIQIHCFILIIIILIIIFFTNPRKFSSSKVSRYTVLVLPH